MEIILYATRVEAEQALEYLETVAIQYWQGLGYLVDGKSVIGKNAATGQDEPDSHRTTGWSEIFKHPDGGFYFSSPRRKYGQYFDDLVTGDYTETTYYLTGN